MAMGCMAVAAWLHCDGLHCDGLHGDGLHGDGLHGYGLHGCIVTGFMRWAAWQHGDGLHGDGLKGIVDILHFSASHFVAAARQICGLMEINSDTAGRIRATWKVQCLIPFGFLNLGYFSDLVSDV